jgi:hypothetical protein
LLEAQQLCRKLWFVLSKRNKVLLKEVHAESIKILPKALNSIGSVMCRMDISQVLYGRELKRGEGIIIHLV